MPKSPFPHAQQFPPVFATVWEYRVKPGRTREFEQIYGPAGDWAHFFQKGAGYLGTALLSELSRQRRYLTLDYWKSSEDYERFRQTHRKEYEAIDRRCALLTEQETRLGAFTCSDAVPCNAHNRPGRRR